MLKLLQVFILLCIQFNSFGAIKIPGFTAVFDSKKNAVLLYWEYTSSETGTFIIQHSEDNHSWADISLQVVNLSMQVKSFHFEDNKSSASENYYRVKFINVNGIIDYSAVIRVITPFENKAWVMYPVPVKDILTLEYKGTETIKGVINIFIQQNSGKIITRIRKASIYKTIQIPVNNLCRGIYDIRIIIKGNVVWNERFIK